MAWGIPALREIDSGAVQSMPEFLDLLAPEDALKQLLSRLAGPIGFEPVPSQHALGRVTAEEITAPESLPAFPRSTMDGFSLRAADTFGATEGLPAYLELVGEVSMGEAPQLSVSAAQGARAYTGGMLAKGADAVVMVENTQAANETTIEVLRPVAPGENVVQVGEDVSVGETVLQSGRVLRPHDIGGLLALGISEVFVRRRPRVSIVSTGDELVPPEQSPAQGRVRDINTYTISALVEEAGGTAVPIGLVEDDYEAQREAALRGLSEGDMLVFSAGSSVSARDMTAEVLAGLGEPGVLAHGLSHKPGKPTIVALIDGKPAFGLPGNPVSAVVVFEMVVRPAIFALVGRAHPYPQSTVRARLTRDVASLAGREDHVQVRLLQEGKDWMAEPVFGKSNLIYTLIRAHGSITVPLDKAGLYAGELVEVVPY